MEILFYLGLLLGLGIVSVVLAYFSLGSYLASPSETKEVYGLFLVQRSHLLDKEALEELYLKLQPQELMVSVERLFKGERRALVIYGPLSVLFDFQSRWGLVEIEDYSLTVHPDHTTVWEMEERVLPTEVWSVSRLVGAAALLSDEEQFWWQVVLKPVGKKKAFNSSLRGVVVAGSWSLSKERSRQLIETLKEDHLVRLPTRYVQRELLTLFQQRVLVVRRGKKMMVTPQEIPHLF